MRRSGARGTGGEVTPVSAVMPEVVDTQPPEDDLGVRVLPPAHATNGIWAVSRDGEIVPGARFEGAGAEGRARTFAAWARTEVREGRTQLPRGKCSLGNPCDRDLAHVLRLSDLQAPALARLSLCAEHAREVRGEASPPVATPADAVPSGRRRKAVPS